MGGKCAPNFAYTVVYVKDVEKSVDLYSKAFGLAVRRLDDNHRWGELQSGATTIAFTPLHHQHEIEITEKEHDMIHTHESLHRNKVELCFTYQDLDAAFKHAVENGAAMVAALKQKEWGQKVGYVRDIDGHVIRMGSLVAEPQH